MGKPSGSEIWEALERIEIPTNLARKFKKFAMQKDVKTVLSLGGGGAKGCVGNFVMVYLLEKLDLMQYIEEVWGVSAGSMIGAAYCSGVPWSELASVMSKIRLRDFVTITAKAFDGEGYFGTERIHAFFKKMLAVETFEQCKKPFFALSTRYTGESDEIVVFDKGLLADAVTASIAIPDVFKPFVLDGKKYCDGGLIENTPCLSVHAHHRDSKDPRRLAILSTCFGKENYADDERGNFMAKIMNLLATYRYRLQLVQNELTRTKPNTGMLMINLDVPIPKMAFNRMGPIIVPVYGQLLDKLSYICELDNWNITY